MGERVSKSEPNDLGMLDVGDENSIYWETWGNPTGKPAVVFHGGPGSGCPAALRGFFDLDLYRVVLFDQRNCGRSTPSASEGTTNLAVNTTSHLLSDIELLRDNLGIERWLVFGLSWGSTLGLAYAERHPDRITEIVFAGVTMTRRSEIEWLYRGVAPLVPAEWQRFRSGVPSAEREGDLVEVYHRLLYDPDPVVRDEAAKNWSDWDWAISSLDPEAKPDERWSDPKFRLARARIVTHYFRHNAWLDDGILLRDAASLSAIPGVLIQGRLDLGSPLVTAWELNNAWPESDLVIVKGAGHSVGDPGMAEAIWAATKRFATVPT